MAVNSSGGNGDGNDLDEENDENDLVTARPRRMSDVNVATKILPIPPGTSFFLFSQRNRLMSHPMHLCFRLEIFCSIQIQEYLQTPIF